MKKPQKPNFLEWNNIILINSLRKIDFGILLIIVFDVIFYLSSGFLALFWFNRISVKMSSFNLPTDVISLGYEKLNQLAGDVKLFFYFIIFSFILLLIAIIFLASIIKGIIWAKTTKTRITFKLISKFLGLNLIWMGFWFVLFFLVSWLVEPWSLYFALVRFNLLSLYFVVLLIINLYFTNTSYTLFMRQQGLKSIPNALALNISKMHLFLIPYALIIFLFFIIFKIIAMVQFQYSWILSGIIIIAYLAMVRYYVSTLTMEIQKYCEPHK